MTPDKLSTNNPAHNPYEAPGHADERSVALAEVFPVAVALIVIAILDILMSGLGAALLISRVFDPELDEIAKHGLVRNAAYITLHGTYSVPILFGAISMIRLRSRLLAAVAVWLCIIPTIAPCFVLSLPFAIWGILVLRRPNIKAAFMSSAMLTNDRSVAATKVFPVAVGLIVTCIIGINGNGFGEAFTLERILDPEIDDMTRGEGLWYAMYYLISSVYALPIIVGAITLSRLRSYGFSLFAVCLAVVPLLAPCFILSIPFGIWGLVVLRKPEVKAGFAARMSA